MKKILFSLLFIGISSIYAQNNLSGTITDSTNNPLLGVEIYSEQLHKELLPILMGSIILTIYLTEK